MRRRVVKLLEDVTRDTLLPKLLSREMGVKESEPVVGRVV